MKILTKLLKNPVYNTRRNFEALIQIQLYSLNPHNLKFHIFRNVLIKVTNLKKYFLIIKLQNPSINKSTLCNQK